MLPLTGSDGAPPDLLLLGEQHDAPQHQVMHRKVIEELVRRGTLGAVVLEMAERGHSTAGLPRDASEAQVRQALGWDESGWPWTPYRPAVMAAVAGGVPVIGGNLPRTQMHAAMANAQLDRMLPGPALKAQQQAVRAGHCGLLPERQITPMTRIQIARDESMAQTLQDALVPGKTVVLLAGGGHVDARVGIPLHLRAGLRVQSTQWPAEPSKKDYCAELEARLRSHGMPGRMP
ncbi:MAG TPA: ChaN family lipoprotein [Ramlibacter sp.]|nr:ChaN family lipoprotein [Ramlibacter sp.]